MQTSGEPCVIVVPGDQAIAPEVRRDKIAFASKRISIAGLDIESYPSLGGCWRVRHPGLTVPFYNFSFRPLMGSLHLEDGTRITRTPAQGAWENFVPRGMGCDWTWRASVVSSMHLLVEESLLEQTAEEEDIPSAVVREHLALPQTADIGFNSPVYSVSSSLNEEVLAGNPFGKAYAESLARALLIRLLIAQCNDEGGPVRSSGLPPVRVRRVIEFIEANLAADPDLSQLAQIAGLSPGHFSRAFKVSTGLSPSSYFQQMRVEKAKTLLTTTNDSLVEVSAELGFANQSHFTHVFRRLTGVTPGRYRRGSS